ncbi:MAG: DNA polymerase I [Lachnospiraceae bacterium]|nr:DNA polymerase I [Lachnospiraceae bacterium]MDD3659152.1 DNA polymerase I [Lachnospiraceae bacterium]
MYEGRKIVLIDGHSILNRAFYGVPPLTNAEGLPTNAVYGFLNILLKILEEEAPQFLCVAFDVKAPTFRHVAYSAYKGTRKGMPDELHEQVPILKNVLQAMGIMIIEKDGFEADDLLGTLAVRAERAGMDVSLVSGDRDLLQIATAKIKIRIPKTKAGKTEIEDYYEQDVVDKYSVTPRQFIELKGLMGDSSDNIPGVPKIGEKTATELIVKYASIQGVYDHIDEITKKSIKESLEINKELADLSLFLATINTQSEIDLNFDQLEIKNVFTAEAYEWFRRLEFKNLMKKYDDNSHIQQETATYQIIESKDSMKKMLEKAMKTKRIAAWLLRDDCRSEDIIGLSIALSEQELYFIRAGLEITSAELISAMKLIIDFVQDETDTDRRFLGFQLKDEYRFYDPLHTRGLFDVQLAAYLLNPLKNDYKIEDIANEYLDFSMPLLENMLGKKKFSQTYLDKKDEVEQYAVYYVQTCLRAAEKLEDHLIQDDMFALFEEIEMPLTLVLWEIEKNGIMVRADELKNYGDALVGRINELEQKIVEESGVVFNINSPKQLGEILFEKMGIPGGKKTKTGYSTGVEILEKLAAEYPIAADVLEYRGLTKLKSTYADGLAVYIGSDSRIHGRFHQTIAATGRISSTEPNLQNIPVRMELGRLIRKVFVPKEGHVFVDADYSQIELRILAHMSGDEQLIDAYRSSEDIHRITASKVFHTPFEEVTPLQRRNAKAVNFGIVYGISSFGLSQDLSISRKEASKYIEEYFHTYPGIKKFLDQCVTDAKEKGYSVTLFNRRRPVPELKSSNFMQRSFGERVAMNAPIQGTAADIMKIAMINVNQELKQQNLKSKLVLQVHDELLIEASEDEVELVKRILEEQMKHAAQLKVSLEVDVHVGKNWYDAK